MKAKDITPGDYEVREYKGAERKATITKVEKRTIRVMPAGSYESYPSSLWRAIEILSNGKERLWPLAQVIRPWDEAIADHDAAEADRREAQRVRNLLQDTLRANGIDVLVRGSDVLNLNLSREQAETLARLILGNTGAE